MKLLLLGGTAEARELAASLAAFPDVEATLSLAGATTAPARFALPVRRGGFGGVHGLSRYLAAEAIDGVIDATHPFAATMSANAVAASAALGIPLWRIERPAWQAGPGDDWHDAADAPAAARRLAEFGPRVFLSVGARSLAPFADVAGKHWIVRSIEAPEPAPAFGSWTLIRARPPFAVADEIALFRMHDVDVLVTKNSGARATAAKLDAARRLGLPVVMIARPALSAPQRHFGSAEALIAALPELHQARG
ncbi:cobalt-precorrin-6A reductase [Salinisphaera sp. RV14]|uniref:cobalt-precorrin-6A reductase n=1 Tax=Salinisphaera sp. RV14 TaxID=3454140 RepID=UPI003F853B8E